ncbi:MAG: hypothetical protein ACOX89_07055 [Lutispora sp.]|uniref:hypothetical protein n=1 Tax=Lutispora sp. TaxID=2828727 RepID=UPI00356A9861
MGIASHDCCKPTEGLFCNNWIWIILLILFFCGGFGNCGCFGGNFLGNNSIWILIILFFIFFSGKRFF